MTRRPPHRSRRAVFPHRAPRWDALPHSQMSGRRLSPSGRLAWGLRPCMAGPRVLGRRRPTVTPFPVWTALPPSAYSGVIRLPMDHQPPSVRSGRPPWCQESMGSPTFLTLLSLPARPCGPRQTLRPLALPLPLSGLPVRENRRRLPHPPSRGCPRLPGVRSPCRPPECPVDASSDSFGVFHLLHRCNTRYRWLASPSLAGTCTLQETPSFAWRTNASAQPRPKAGAERTL